jgi:hypothetical protein
MVYLSPGHLFAQGSKAKVVSIGFYNLENLFDTIDDPKTDDAEFTPTGSGKWDTKRYHTKLEHLASVISQLGDEYVKTGPAIVGVSEVENRSVVYDLVRTEPLKSLGYDFIHFDSPDYRGIDVALIYQTKVFKVKSTKLHPLIMADTNFHTRDVLQVDGYLDGELIHVLVNHWPSRSSGELETMAKRNAAADNCYRAVEGILKEEPKARIIIMGDLNDDPTDESVMKHLKAKPKPDNLQPGDLYNPMWQLFKDGIGSLAYRDSWNLFDQIIVSSELVNKQTDGYRFYKARIFNKKYLLQPEGQYAGYPYRTYGSGVYLGGYSDHLPAYIFLVKEFK